MSHSAIIIFRNLTDEPIVAQIHPCKQTKTQLILQPSCRLTTRLAKGELSLHPHPPSRTGTGTDSDVPNLVFENSLALEEGRLFDSADEKISLSTLFKGSWNVVHVSKWRVFSFKVRYSTCRPRVVMGSHHFIPRSPVDTAR